MQSFGVLSDVNSHVAVAVIVCIDNVADVCDGTLHDFHPLTFFKTVLLVSGRLSSEIARLIAPKSENIHRRHSPRLSTIDLFSMEVSNLPLTSQWRD